MPDATVFKFPFFKEDTNKILSVVLFAVIGLLIFYVLGSDSISSNSKEAKNQSSSSGSVENILSERENRIEELSREVENLKQELAAERSTKEELQNKLLSERSTKEDLLNQLRVELATNDELLNQLRAELSTKEELQNQLMVEFREKKRIESRIKKIEDDFLSIKQAVIGLNYLEYFWDARDVIENLDIIRIYYQNLKLAISSAEGKF